MIGGAKEKFLGLSRIEDRERGGAAGDQGNFDGLSRDNRVEAQKTSRIDGTSVTEIEDPEVNHLTKGTQAAQPGNDSDKLRKKKGKRVNAGNKGIVEKLKREITSLTEAIDKMNIEYAKLDEKNQNLEKALDTMGKETDVWRNRYIELLKNGNNERQVIFESYTQICDRLSRFSGAVPSFPRST